MGQEASSTALDPNHKKTKINASTPSQQRILFEGILKIESVPFKGCGSIEMDGRTYFIEKTTASLYDIIKQKSRTQRKFESSEVTNMIINLVYALAQLENIKIAYPDLTLNNIYLSAGKYKLMSPDFIHGDTYTHLKQNLRQRRAQYTAASPQLIIAARCHEPVVNQQEILLKSSVFALGMVMLQVCTLKNSADCYDLNTYEILDTVVTQRIQEIEANYQDARIARIVANMLDYDYEERMKPADLAIWINREINENDAQGQERTPSFNKALQEINIGNNLNSGKETIKSRVFEEKIIDPQKEENQECEREEDFQEITKRKHSRLKDIRSKIIKEKMKNNRLQAESSIQARSASKSPHINKKIEKNLPNPYLIRPYEKTPPKQVPRKYTLEKQVMKCQQLSTRREEIQRSTNLNLRYKYNISEQERLAQDEPRMSSGRRFAYIPSGSADRSIQKLSYDQIIKRSTSRVKQQPALNISRFTYEAIETSKFPAQENKKSKTPLREKPRMNIQHTQNRCYERHQQIDWGSSHPYSKNLLKREAEVPEIKQTEKFKQTIQLANQKKANQNMLMKQYSMGLGRHVRF